MASVSSLHSKCFGAVSEQRMRNEKNAGSKRAGRGWSARKSGPLGSVGGGVGCKRTHHPPPYGPVITVNFQGNQLL